MNRKPKVMNQMDYIRANRKGSRDAELDFEHGWKASHKVHKNKKAYTRKLKHKNRNLID